MQTKQKNVEKYLKNSKGITLIALVITIVVMLILAGVTINLTLGENGIFTTAQQAAKNYTDAQNKELEDMAYFTNTVNNIVKGKTTLTNQITGADYGKYINYSVTVEDTVLDNWRVFYNDKTTNNVYIIYDGYLPNTLIPEEVGMQTITTYQAYWKKDDFSTNTEVVATLTNKENWQEFAAGIEGATAYGAPTNEMFVNSWNENLAVNSTTLTALSLASDLTDSSKLYIPYTGGVDGCYGYWLASPVSSTNLNVWCVSTVGNKVTHFSCDVDSRGVRPIVCLPSDIIGTVGSSVIIDK